MTDEALAKSLGFAANKLKRGMRPMDLLKASGFSMRTLEKTYGQSEIWRKFNPNHMPGGCPEGGQFCSAGDGGGGVSVVPARYVQSGKTTPISSKTSPEQAQSDIAKTAAGYEGSKNWLYSTQDGDSYKCNQFVADVLRESGVPVDGVHRTLTGTAAPTASDWANPNFVIPGWEIIDPKDAKPGDVIAERDWWSNPVYSFGASGHVGIVVGDKQTASSNANVIGPWKGMITVNNWGFRPGQNVVVRRYVAVGA